MLTDLIAVLLSELGQLAQLYVISCLAPESFAAVLLQVLDGIEHVCCLLQLVRCCSSVASVFL